MNEINEDAGRTACLVQKREERARRRLLGEAWSDWQAFVYWSDIDHPSECTYVRRHMPDPMKERIAELLQGLEDAIAASEESVSEVLKKEEVRLQEWEANLRHLEANIGKWQAGLKLREQRIVISERHLDARNTLSNQVAAQKRRIGELEQQLRGVKPETTNIPQSSDNKKPWGWLWDDREKEVPPPPEHSSRRERKRYFAPRGGPTSKPKGLTCSFCRKPQSQVASIIAGPGVYICNECVGQCTDIFIQKDVPFAYTTNLPAKDLLEHLEARLEDDPDFIKGFIKTVLKHLE
jgi:hypothetical protein